MGKINELEIAKKMSAVELHDGAIAHLRDAIESVPDMKKFNLHMSRARLLRVAVSFKPLSEQIEGLLVRTARRM